MAPSRWFDREFELATPISARDELVGRLRSAPTRLERMLQGMPPERLAQRQGASWSIAEQAGHLSDLEPLWLGRVEDLMSGLPRLRPADLENEATWAANHNARPLAAILAEFRGRRMRLVDRIEALTHSELTTSALHPRLEQPMTVVDLCFFVAEHDDHHLETIRELMRSLGG